MKFSYFLQFLHTEVKHIDVNIRIISIIMTQKKRGKAENKNT